MGCGELPGNAQKWESATFRLNIDPSLLQNFNFIKTYAWNKPNNVSYIDDIRIRFLGIPAIKNFVVTEIKNSSFTFDFEKSSVEINDENISDKQSHSGKYSYFIDGGKYSASFCKTAGDVINDTLKTVFASTWIYPLDEKVKCTLAFELRTKNNDQLVWAGKSTEKYTLTPGKWQKINAYFNLAPEDYRKIKPDDVLCIYVLNNSKSKLFTDDFEVSFGGTPEKQGLQVNVDMNSNSGGSYSFNRYHPPYPVTFLTLENIHNDNAPSLVKNDSVSHGNIRPDQLVTRGDFTGSNAGDQLLTIAKDKVEVYLFCKQEQRFVMAGSFPLNINSPLTNIYTGDFDGDKRDELLVVYGIKSKLIKIENKINLCTDNSGQLKTITLSDGELGKNTSITTGNFSGDGKDDLFLVDGEGNYSIKTFSAGKWITVNSGNVPSAIFNKSSQQVAGKFFGTRHDRILSVYKEKNRMKISLLDFSEKKMKLIPVPDESRLDDVFETGERLSVLRSAKGNDEILARNNSWRFELKRISADKNGFYISSTIDFKGYPKDHNPKYYEVLRLLPGNFKGNGNSLIAIMRNCADEPYYGWHCNEYETVPDLPDAIQLYNFPE